MFDRISTAERSRVLVEHSRELRERSARLRAAAQSARARSGDVRNSESGPRPQLAFDVHGDSVRLIGELDLATAPLLASFLDTHPQCRTLDLRDVRFFDSCGLRTLIMLKAGRSTLRIPRDAVSSRVLRVIDLTATYWVLD